MTIDKTTMLSAGELLKRRRTELGIPLQTASEETKIQLKYLSMIENNQFDQFESETFLRGFLQNYSKYLGLKPDKILAIYRRDVKGHDKEETIKLQKPLEKKRISPKAVGEIILLSFVFVVIIYFGYQLFSFQKVPDLKIFSPEDNVTVVEEIITIQGETDNNTIITINDVSVNLDESGMFEEDIALNEGINTINIKAVRENNESKESVKVLTVTREPSDDTIEEIVEEVVEEKVILDQFTLKVIGGEAWVQLFIDGVQELGQIIPNGFDKTYTVTEKVELTTGKYSITQVFINGETEPTPLRLTNSVGVLSCTMENNRLNCDN